MNKYLSLLLSGSFALTTTFLVGCNPWDQSSSDSESTVSEQMDEVQAEARDATSRIKTFTYAEKEAFVENFEQRLKELNQNIDELSAKVDQSSLAVQEEAKPLLAELRGQVAVLENELAKVKDANESTWESVKRGTNQAYEDLKTSLRNARDWVSEKIAP